MKAAAVVAAYFVGFVVMLTLLHGCTPPTCYDAIGINPPARFAIVFNHCTGEVEYRNLPPLPMERAQPEVKSYPPPARSEAF